MNFPRFPGMVKARTSDEIDLFLATCQAFGLEPAYVGACIEFETGGTWSPQSHGRNAYPGENPPYAVGLIGFAPATARALGTTGAELLTMEFEQQLGYVIRHFQAVGIKRLKRPADYYAAVFWPKAVGTDNSFVIAGAGSAVYAKNSGLDSDGKGYITTGDLDRVMARKLGYAPLPSAGVRSVSAPAAAPVLGVAIVLLALGIFASTVWGIHVRT